MEFDGKVKRAIAIIGDETCPHCFLILILHALTGIKTGKILFKSFFLFEILLKKEGIPGIRAEKAALVPDRAGPGGCKPVG